MVATLEMQDDKYDRLVGEPRQKVKVTKRQQLLLDAVEEEKKDDGIGGDATEREPLAKGGLKSDRNQVSARFKELEM